jgi:CubicO group peptidase (beta-lactamase class C family)
MRKLLLLICSVPLFASGQKTTADLLREFLTGQHDYFDFNGNVLYAVDGKKVFSQSFGFSDFNTKQLLDENSVFELASLTKQFTAMAVMICKEKNLLRYDDKVKKFLPSLPYSDITVRQLLTHTSGLPDYEKQFEKNWDHKKIATNRDVIEMLGRLHDSLRFSPGSKWEYSNTGYALLASIIEKVSGKSYAEFLDTEIFSPLGMKHSFVLNTRRGGGRIPPGYALGFIYSKTQHKYILPDEDPGSDYVYYLDGIVGDGTVNSTTGDLLIWENALQNGKLVSRSSIDEMLSPLVQMNPRDSLQYYGFGVMVQPRSEYGKIISHTGGWPGYTTYLLHREKRNETLVALSNNEKITANIQVTLQSILNGEEVLMPYEHREIKIDTGLLDRYAGKYNAFLTLEFIKKDGKLWRHRTGTADIELKPESLTKFFYGDGSDRQIEFELDPTGKVTKAWFINTGQKGEMKKLE